METPKRKVFIINEPKGNRALLGNYGEVVHLCPGWIENRDLPAVLAAMMAGLSTYQDGDLLVFGGHAKLNMVAFHHVLTEHGVLRQLLPNQERWYVATHDGRENSDGTKRTWWLPR